MRSIRERINRLFDERFAEFPAPTEQAFSREWTPPVDIHEDKDNFVVKAELPGMNKEDVSIEIKDNVLTLKGERKYEKETKREDYHRMERSYGSFSRCFSLPSKVSEVAVKATKDAIRIAGEVGVDVSDATKHAVTGAIQAADEIGEDISTAVRDQLASSIKGAKEVIKAAFK